MRTGFNVSSTTLRDPVAVGWIIDRIAGGEHKVIVEVDETALLHSSAIVVKHLLALRDAGASIVLDDFGVGTSSLRALHAVAFDGVKLHGSLLEGGSNARSASIIKGCLLYTSPSPRDS